MGFETKINLILKIINRGDFSNRQELLNACESLKGLLACSSADSLLVVIKQLKNNAFYQQFKLDTEPEFFEAIFNKIPDKATVEKALKISDINYSWQEREVIKQRLHILELLFNLDSDLAEADEFSKAKSNNKPDERVKPDELDESGESDESDESDDELFEIYFDDLKELKAILSSEKVTPQHISWFLDSDLFDLISGASDCYNVTLQDFYQVLLERAKINTKRDLLEHKHVLFKKNEKSQKHKEQFDHEGFYSILKKHQKQSVDINTTPFKASIINAFYKPPRAKELTPAARYALHNNLKRYLSK